MASKTVSDGLDEYFNVMRFDQTDAEWVENEEEHSK